MPPTLATDLVSADDLAELTGKAYRNAQRRELDKLGIPYRMRSDGGILTTWTQVNAAITGEALDAEPDWSAVA